MAFEKCFADPEDKLCINIKVQINIQFKNFDEMNDQNLKYKKSSIFVLCCFMCLSSLLFT